MMDFETAAKMSGARFTILHSGLARMERALAQLMLDTHTQEHGYTEVSPPLLVRDNALHGTGQLPKFAADQFECFGEFRKLELELKLKQMRDAERNSSMSDHQEINQILGQAMMSALQKNIDTSWVAPTFKELENIFDQYKRKFLASNKEF